MLLMLYNNVEQNDVEQKDVIHGLASIYWALVWMALHSSFLLFLIVIPICSIVLILQTQKLRFWLVKFMLLNTIYYGE